MNDLDRIGRLIALYSQLLDDERIEEWCDLFAEDAVFVAHGTELAGRDRIAEELAPMLARVQIKHLLGIPVIDLISGDRAKAWTDITSFVRGDAGVSVATIGRYYDELERGADDLWRLSRRELVAVSDPLPPHLTPSPSR